MLVVSYAPVLYDNPEGGKDIFETAIALQQSSGSMHKLYMFEKRTSCQGEREIKAYSRCIRYFRLHDANVPVT